MMTDMFNFCIIVVDKVCQWLWKNRRLLTLDSRIRLAVPDYSLILRSCDTDSMIHTSTLFDIMDIINTEVKSGLIPGDVNISLLKYATNDKTRDYSL